MRSNILTGILLLIIGGLLGWIVASYYSTGSAPVPSGASGGVGGGPAPSFASLNSKASDFRIQVQLLFRDHTSISEQYLQKIIKSEDTSSVKSRLDKNTQMLVNLISSIWGNSAGNQLNIIWNDRIKAYASYAKAAKNNDSRGKNDAKNILISESSDFEKFMDRQNSVSVERIGDVLSEHAQDVMALVDATIAKNESKSLELASRSQDQSSILADYFAQIVVGEKPQLFR